MIVAVFGGSFTGLSAAYYIRSISPHKRVVVLEAKGCGIGAPDETALWC